MKVKAIIYGIILSPGELMKWHVDKNDYIFINSDGDVVVGFNRNKINVPKRKSVVFQCHNSSFYFKNVYIHPVCLQIITFYCRIKMNFSSFVTNFEDAPFLSILTEKKVSEANRLQILNVLKYIHKSQRPQQSQIYKKHIDSRLIRINRFIRKNFKTQITLQDLADYAGVHPTYLSNTYSKVFDISPIYYLNQLRIDTATELLKHSDLTIKDIGAMVGYNSLPQFSSIFKRFNSMTPSQYREKMLK